MLFKARIDGFLPDFASAAKASSHIDTASFSPSPAERYAAASSVLTSGSAASTPVQMPFAFCASPSL